MVTLRTLRRAPYSPCITLCCAACLSALLGCGNKSVPPAPADFHRAVAVADTTAILTFVERGLSIDATTDTGSTALMYAARQGDLALVRFLLRNGSKASTQDSRKRSVLSYALASRFPSQSSVDITRELLDAGANANGAGERVPPIIAAAYMDGPATEIIKLLVTRGASLETRDSEGNTALIIAGRNGKVDVVELLVSMGADVNVRDGQGHTLVSLCMRQPDVVRVLFKSGAKPR